MVRPRCFTKDEGVMGKMIPKEDIKNKLRLGQKLCNWILAQGYSNETVHSKLFNMNNEEFMKVTGLADQIEEIKHDKNVLKEENDHFRRNELEMQGEIKQLKDETKRKCEQANASGFFEGCAGAKKELLGKISKLEAKNKKLYNACERLFSCKEFHRKEAKKLKEALAKVLTADDIRESVIWFAREMEKVLKQNDHKIHWSQCDMDYLIDCLHKEMEELGIRLIHGLSHKEEVIKEAVDVANFAMMIADKYRNIETFKKRA
jgi:hypothetical protein